MAKSKLNTIPWQMVAKRYGQQAIEHRPKVSYTNLPSYIYLGGSIFNVQETSIDRDMGPVYSGRSSNVDILSPADTVGQDELRWMLPTGNPYFLPSPNIYIKIVHLWDLIYFKAFWPYRKIVFNWEIRLDTTNGLVSYKLIATCISVTISNQFSSNSMK